MLITKELLSILNILFTAESLVAWWKVGTQSIFFESMNELLTSTQPLGTYFNESEKLIWTKHFHNFRKTFHTFSAPEFIKHFQIHISFNSLNSWTVVSMPMNEKTE